VLGGILAVAACWPKWMGYLFLLIGAGLCAADYMKLWEPGGGPPINLPLYVSGLIFLLAAGLFLMLDIKKKKNETGS